jgi:coenzyme F420-reducing hydrogenase beta subunit
MEKSREGFYIAQANEKNCINCGKCSAICSMNERLGNDVPLSAFAVYSINETVRFNATSGGVFPTIAANFLEAGGIVYGAAFRGSKVEHCRIVDKRDLYQILGSKYVQSNVFACHKHLVDDIRQGELVLFSGTPCQIAGIKTLLAKEDTSKLYTVDLICHGVPSPAIFDLYYQYLERKHRSKIATYKFRSKKDASDIISYNSEIFLCSKHGKKKKVILNGNEDPYVLKFLTNALQSNACFECPFTNLDRVGDLTLGDFWGVENVYHELKDEAKKGMSLVLINSEKGKSLFEKQNDLVSIRTEQAEYLPYNAHLSKPASKNDLREALYDSICSSNFSIAAFKHNFLPFTFKLYLIKRRIKGMMKNE